MKKIFSILTPLVLLTLFAFKDEGGMKKNKNGLFYKLVKNDKKVKEGKKAKKGDLLTMEVVYKTEKDSVLFDSKKNGRPIQVEMRKPLYKGSLEEGFAMMRKGDSALFKTVADSFFIRFLDGQLPAFITKGSYLSFNVKMIDITSKVKNKKEQAKLEAIEQAKMDSLKVLEVSTLDVYLKENKITTKPTASGLIYIQTKVGNGAKAEVGKMVSVNYTGSLLNGKIFDTSIEEIARKTDLYDANRNFKPIEFPLGQGQVIPGWDEAIKLMKVGEKATIFLPSSIAYGDNGTGPIPPFATLKFDIELVEVK
jgi:FKBP-type peptidyl-prolyl cis-trans isomerase FkpA